MTNMLNVYRFTMLAAEVRNIGFELVKDNTNIELAVTFKEKQIDNKQCWLERKFAINFKIIIQADLILTYL